MKIMEKEFKGTKGEWILTKCNKAFAEVKGYSYFEISTSDESHGKWIAEVLDNEDDQSLANAKLMAASKTMLKALQDVKEWLDVQEERKHNAHIRIINAALKEALD